MNKNSDSNVAVEAVENLMPDWPGDGAIDLNLHDLPHKSSTTEWWYLHAHLTTEGGRKFGLFASFFRHAIALDKKKGEYDYSHSVIWALSDLDNHKYYTKSLVDRRAPKIGLKQFKSGGGNRDPFIRKATTEMLKKGVVPFPDELLIGDPIIPWHELNLNYNGQIYKKNQDQTYQLQLRDENQNINIDLKFEALIKPVRHGDNGIIYNSAVENMFYYFIPKCRVSGQVDLKDETHIISPVSTGWYDHEFGARPKTKKSITKKNVAWNWVAIQLDNGYQLTVYDVHTSKTIKDKDTYLILVDPKGQKHKTQKFKFDSYGPKWTSTRTFNEYPTKWRISSEAFKLDLEMVAAFDQQEFGTVISKAAFWEGRLNVTGKHQNKKITGTAYLERHGHITESLPGFLKAVSKTTLKSIQRLLPLTPDRGQLEELVSKKGNKSLTKDLDSRMLNQKLIRPIREIADRGGKSWRSYATMACCDAVGGNSQDNIDWLALPELLHTGSLIIDDVQDKSIIRRGGPTVHTVYGEPLAINSGAAAYFLGQICIYHTEQPDWKKVQIYDWYFEAMRAAHSGQALDIQGLDYMMPGVLKDINVAKLLPKRVLSIHRLKSAAPASYLAKIGGLLGDGSAEQIQGLGDFFEALGISFQIIDDVLNLNGFKNDLKTRAEDLTAGKITYPVAQAFSLMNEKDKIQLWNIVKKKTSDLEELSRAIKLIEKYNAIKISEKYARQHLERAWKKLDPLLDDTMIKINLRAFCWFVLDRTY
ncbi:MAG: polyprenyl synthetase family protein [Saprospiraceae bacterium]|nr:polyprenyl synthetase family protein [Saprospiraceae bacterium]